jgi:hypothetical protein
LYIFCALTRVFARETVKLADTVEARAGENCARTASITGTLVVNAARVGSSSALVLLTVAAVAATLEINRAPEPVLHRCPARGAERAARAFVRMVERYVIGIGA